MAEAAVEPDNKPAPAAATPKEAGLVAINMLVSPADRLRIKILAAQTGLSAQRIGHEAWNLWLEKRGLDPLTPATANVPSGMKRPKGEA